MGCADLLTPRHRAVTRLARRAWPWAVVFGLGWSLAPRSPEVDSAPELRRPLVWAGAAPAQRREALRDEPPPTPIALLTASDAPVSQRSVCGLGAVQLAPDDPDPLQRVAPELRRSVRDAVDALMLASDDPQMRAAALWMAVRIRGREVASRVDQLVRLAVAAQDPVVYAMALDACRGRNPAEAGACSQLSRAQWVRLDPDNAVPWRELAAEAHEHDESDTEDMAMQLADRARRSDAYPGLLPLLVDKALGVQAPPWQRTLALGESWSAEAVRMASQPWPAPLGQPAPLQELDLSCDGVERMQAWMRERRVALAR